MSQKQVIMTQKVSVTETNLLQRKKINFTEPSFFPTKISVRIFFFLQKRSFSPGFLSEKKASAMEKKKIPVTEKFPSERKKLLSQKQVGRNLIYKGGVNPNRGSGLSERHYRVRGLRDKSSERWGWGQVSNIFSVLDKASVPKVLVNRSKSDFQKYRADKKTLDLTWKKNCAIFIYRKECKKHYFVDILRYSYFCCKFIQYKLAHFW